MVPGYIKLMEYDTFGRASKTVTSLGQNGSDGDHYEKVTYDQYGRTFQVFDAARAGDTFTNNGVEHRYNAYGYQFRLVDAVYSGGTTRKVYQTVTAMDARGNVTGETLGNGVTRTVEHDDATGRVTRLLGKKPNGTAIQDLNLDWDAIGNLRERLEMGYGAGSQQRIEKELYLYDHDIDGNGRGLNRLRRTTWYDDGAQTDQQTLAYNSLGNITSKSDVGSYSYDRTCGCGPHAVTQAGGTTYQYDTNGNMVRDSSGRKIVYTTFDKTYRLTQGGNTVTFAYGPDRSRYKRTDSDASGTKTTLYIGSVEKITNTDGTKEWKRYIGANLMITQDVDTNGAIQSQVYSYFLKDHLGSINYLTASSGEVAQVMGFDPWGKRLASHQNAGTEPWATFQFDLLLTTRGFTGHEMVDKLNVIHMNGRIYDPTLARFLQADPFIQAASDGQMFNRYSYVRNNPLNATDPSGYFWQAVAAFALKAMFFAGVSHMAFDMAQMSGASWLSTLVSIGACAFGDVAGCVGGAFGSSWAATGDLMSAVEAGGIAFASAFAFNYIGEALSDASAANIDAGRGIRFGSHGDPLQLTAKQIVGKIAAHGAVGGVMADIQGGKFAHGFVSAGIVAAASPGLDRIQGPTVGGIDISEVAASAILGGTVSNITGGKFANGAITGAMQNLFNQQGANEQRKARLNQARKLTDPFTAGLSDKFEVGPTLVCFTGAGCSVELVADIAALNSVPFTLGAPSEGPMTLFPGQPIVHSRPTDFITVNDAASNHIFSGRVITTTFESQGGVFVFTRGVGNATGFNRAFNQFVGIGPAFGRLHLNIQQHFNPQGPAP